ncbi:hypothetical protein AB0I34_41625 [Kribbella sp. NPDC050281]|uniref:hypothetical protein n=1 Tax=Kribbella sp. NPDC050281 TaxID=3155515 RepID=UPI0033F5EE76
MTAAPQLVELDGDPSPGSLAEASHVTWHISDEELVEWAATMDIPTAGELDGSEPIDDPPAGFSTWDEWRGHRWPPSVF